MTIDFDNKCVSYDDFVRDLAAEVVSRLVERKADPETVSQRRAYELFGRGNVDRWRRKGMIVPAKRPGKMEYRMSELRRCQARKQDYFK